MKYALIVVCALMTTLSAAKAPLKKITCHLQPLALTTYGPLRNPLYTSSKIKNLWSHPNIKKTDLKYGGSQNWSGYVAAKSFSSPNKNSVEYITGTWQIPVLSPSNERTYSAIWVGIDGFNQRDTIQQIGTEHDWVEGMQVNYAWFEMYPDYAYTLIGFPVRTGDTIRARVKHVQNGRYSLKIVNVSRGVYVVVPYNNTILKSAVRTCAEWIVEAPTRKTGILPLANFNTVQIRDCRVRINGVHSSINNPAWQQQEMWMMNTQNETKAFPSALSDDGSAFSVTWVSK